MGKTEKAGAAADRKTSGNDSGLDGAGSSPAEKERRSADEVTPQDAAGYVHEMAVELKRLAETARLSFLAYLLDLVVEESSVQKRGRL